jgi:hypothetical protein
MKFRHVYLITFAISLVSLFTFLTYKFISLSNPSAVAYDDNPTYTLVLPDLEYVISKRDLDASQGDIIIPTRDESVPRIAYNSTDGLLESISSPKDYVLDIDLLRNQLLTQESGSLSITPEYTLRDRATSSISEYNFRLNRIHRTPLNISLKDGSEMTDFALDTVLLRTLLKPISTEQNVPPQINKEALLTYLNDRLTPKQKKYFNKEVAYQNTQKAINLRFMGEATPVVLGVDDGPTSYGEIADKYLEVDLSQQKMYFFINKTLYKEYKISTGAEYPTPVGDFRILNKAPIAFSEIYQVWMPYWMGFKYASDVGAYLGLHEIAHVKDAKGKPVYRYGYYIGDMMTGGCVAMEPKDSREIYNLSDVGMLVRIVK